MAASSQPRPLVDSAFWKHWGDGRAEVSSYDLTYPRYGHPWESVGIAIFVTESFSLEARVKADPRKHAPGDLFPVMKLNLVEDFRTGVYDYNEQSSSFLALGSKAHHNAGFLTNASFSSQEWCGHSWAGWISQPGGILTVP